MTRIAGDIDIDFSNRNAALAILEHVPSSIIKNNKIEKHKTGVYFHKVPTDPITNFSSIDYEVAENMGFYKIDLLNVGVYELIKNEEHLIRLLSTNLDWKLLEYPEFTSNLIHIGNHANMVSKLKPTSIIELAMTLALIRPGKKHLIDSCILHGFNYIADEIWKESNDGLYVFKKSHSVGYATLVKVHAVLLIDQVLI